MPPRLPAARALCAPSPSPLLIRAFSSTPSAAAPPREHPHPHHHTPSPSTAAASSSPSSTTSSLLSINSNDRHKRNAAPGDAASRLLSRYKNRAEAALKTKQAQLELLRNQKNSNDFLKQMPRRWDAGDVYSPHDLSPVEMQKWRKRSLRSNDVVDALGIRPLDMYKNFSLVQEFTSSSGQITHSSGTGLRPVNQRKIAKMIRRVQGMGIYPSIHDHPEMIRDDFFPERRDR
ncbi:37S ribosomal protein RSM18, mitochondrial [Tolypocladium paradoxum]|uniref:Small ribosomal subunit protein bS18m n=1 Tax=Tolypocladium paradoxum TaxID=94208 RepID=A0A2S4KWX0_9HYPO|nr:37S ribosomal protein RSM18, mitochondrial [Tolypocladium paradoxum]